MGLKTSSIVQFQPHSKTVEPHKQGPHKQTQKNYPPIARPKPTPFRALRDSSESKIQTNTMTWDEFDRQDFAHGNQDTEREEEHDSYLNFDILSALSKLKDYYGVLEVDYDATDDAIRSNYIRLALKWHPDKQRDQDSATLRFQEINEAYQG
ncbi:hypothetical protein RHSIM_Rhsim06G0073700 [Rhododendron simsii]|uniref:J domain-containing protein n=1 Tax=Rhododendron simsii TaxID=118357 RepID=A0A834GR31_RHOSS|nr:hypothetical protein RHSIM_Rhsim06G0073700 [Rhododendron simsii]